MGYWIGEQSNKCRNTREVTHLWGGRNKGYSCIDTLGACPTHSARMLIPLQGSHPSPASFPGAACTQCWLVEVYQLLNKLFRGKQANKEA